MVHTFSLNGYNFAVDGGSGSIHALDEISFDILRTMPDGMEHLAAFDEVVGRLKGEYPEDEIAGAYAEIKELAESGLLFTPDGDIDGIIGKERGNGFLKALCINVSHDCDLRCRYCFASKGDYKGGRKLMPAETAFKAVDFLLENSGNRRNIEIDFFGGEPLLNFETIRKTVAYGRETAGKAGKEIHFTVTTNGTLLDDEKAGFINGNMDNVVISIDGRKEVHDFMRCDRAGRGSYGRIVPSALKLVEERGEKSYFIRGTFTAKNLDFSRDVLHLADLGFGEISVEPVVGPGGWNKDAEGRLAGIECEEEEFYLTGEHIPAILTEYERLAEECLRRIRENRGFRFYHFNLNLYDGPCLFKRITACGAGFEYLAVSPDGDLYPCHQFVGMNGFLMGDIYNGIKNGRLLEKFKGSSILTKDKCRKCWAKLFCSGGCHANAYFTNGNIDAPNELSCIMQKKRIECAIMIEAARRGIIIPGFSGAGRPL